MDGYSVDPGRLQDCDAGLAASAVWARSALARLTAVAAPVLATAWQGGAAAAFRLGWEEWLDGAHAMLAALEELAGAVGASGSGYAATDDAVRGAVAGVGR